MFRLYNFWAFIRYIKIYQLEINLLIAVMFIVIEHFFVCEEERHYYENKKTPSNVFIYV